MTGTSTCFPRTRSTEISPPIDLFECLSNSGSDWNKYQLPIEYVTETQFAVGDVTGDGLPEVIYDLWDGAGLEATGLGELYAISGSLESTVLYLGCDPEWGWLSWDGREPSGTSIKLPGSSLGSTLESRRVVRHSVCDDRPWHHTCGYSQLSPVQGNT